MKSYLQIEGLTKSFGDRLLFKDLTLGVFEGDKIGLIAKNGAGKTTLLNIIAGDESYDSGNIVFRNGIKTAILKQIPKYEADKTILEICLSSDTDYANTIIEYERAIDSGDSDKIEKAMQKMDSTNAWEYENKIKQILSTFKITKINQKIGELSGGQVKRIALASVLINEPDFLILDEPTNHLDIDVIEWLENYLSHNKVTLLMVTHDRYFLDRVCSKIIEIDDQQLYEYNGNYNFYLEKREERINAQNSVLAKMKNLYRTELEWMRRQPQARGSKAKYRIDAFHELDNKTKVKHDNSTLELNSNSVYIGKKIFEADNVCKKFGDTVILNNFNYIFSRYEKLGIVGNNGVGKSTFIKLLLGIETPDSGEFKIGETVKFGYYSQEGIQFDEQEKVIDAVRKIAENIVFDEKTKYTASQFLQMFLFSPSKQQDYIYKLSGGEKRRLYLATILMKNPNFLILDEPTNDLDIITLSVLEDYLVQFKGCLIVISHDRFFMDRTVDHLFVFEGNGKIKDFPGNYSDYREWKAINGDKQKNVASKEKDVKHRKESNDKPKNLNRRTFKENREFESLTTEIEVLEKEKKELEEALSSGNLSYEQISKNSQRISELINLLDEKEMRWLELSEKS